MSYKSSILTLIHIIFRPDVRRRSAKSGSETDDLIALGHDSSTGLIDTITSISRGNDSYFDMIN